MRIRACVLFAAIAGLPCDGGEPYRPVIEPANFTHVITNPWFPLTPGTTATFIEKDRFETRENIIAVTHETRTILGVKCVVVHDTVTLDGRLVQGTFNWFAQDRQGAVWIFGEAAQERRPGGRVTTEGSWEAGVKGAQPGIMMPGRPKVGDRYRQEYAANEAEDIGLIVALNDTVTVPAGTFTGCVRTREWSMLESDTSSKWYAKGVGLIRAKSTDGEESLLVSVKRK